MGVATGTAADAAVRDKTKAQDKAKVRGKVVAARETGMAAVVAATTM